MKPVNGKVMTKILLLFSLSNTGIVRILSLCRKVVMLPGIWDCAVQLFKLLYQYKSLLLTFAVYSKVFVVFLQGINSRLLREFFSYVVTSVFGI